jgi:ABC-type uncharacterized transport system substrate-binding protein
VDRGLPLTAPNAASVREGALFSSSFNDASVASILANSINALASGRTVETIPFQVPDFELSINLDTAHAIGLEIDESVLDAAAIILE